MKPDSLTIKPKKNTYSMKAFAIMTVAVVLGVIIASYVKKPLGITN